MNRNGPSLSAAAVLAATLVVLTTAGVSVAAPAASSSTPDATREAPALLEVAQYEGEEPRELQPRYEPVQPQQDKSGYNDEYIFGLTKGIARSTLHPAAKVMIFPMILPLDIVFLPFSIIGGFFG